MSKSNKQKARERVKEDKGTLRFILFGATILFMPFIMLLLLFETRLKMSYKDKLKGLWRVQLQILDGEYRVHKK
jgi:hypothetical protein